MQKFLAVDMFRVIQEPDRTLTQRTSRGAALTAVAAVLAFLMVSNEAYLFFRTDLRSSMAVSKCDMRMELLHFNVSFPAIPCHTVVFEALDPMSGRVFTEQQKTVEMRRTRLVKDTTVAIGEHNEGDGVRKLEGCRVEGTCQIDKVPGNFMIAARGHTHEYGNPNFHFVIHHLWVGDAFPPEDEIPAKLANALGGLEEKGQPPNSVYQFFLSIVPTVFDEGTRVEHLGFQYTATFNHVQADIPPGLYFRHQHSPIAVEYSHRWQTWSHFLVNLCAITGGLITCIGFVAAVMDKFAPSVGGATMPDSPGPVRKADAK